MYKLCLFVVALTHASLVLSLGDGKEESKKQCEKVMAYVALHAELDFGPEPCADDVHSKPFWECVEEKVADESPFHVSLEYCERVGGLR